MNSIRNSNKKTDASLGLRRREEKNIYKKSILFLKENPEYRKHLVLFDLIRNICAIIILQKSIDTEDQKTIAFIGARVFNSGDQSFASLMSGFYQISMSTIRDLVETQFLLDFFDTSPSDVKKWREATNQERIDNYGPGKLYTKLDKRDGFTGERRKEIYKQFCEYAAHVTFPGMKLISDDNKQVMVGSFYDEKKLLNTIVELNRRFGHTVISLIKLMPKDTVSVIAMQIELFEKYGELFDIDVSKFPNYKSIKEMLEKLSPKK